MDNESQDYDSESETKQQQQNSAFFPEAKKSVHLQVIELISNLHTDGGGYTLCCNGDN